MFIEFGITGAISFCLGVTIHFFWGRKKTAYIIQQCKLSMESERATLLAKNEYYERSEKELKLNQENLRARLDEESRLRAAAEACGTRIPTLEKDVLQTQNEASLLRSQCARLQTELQAAQQQHAEKIQLLDHLQQKFTETFRALSAEALHRNNSSFLELAKSSFEQLHGKSQAELEKREQAIQHLVDPMKQVLDKVENKIQQLEKESVGEFAGLRQQVSSLLESEHQLRIQTGNLIQALRSPTVRGRWGELQLRRVIELSGMERYCDFDEQVSVTFQEKQMRPDLVIRLPGRKTLIIDAKTPLEAYLNAVEANDEGKKRAFLSDYSSHVRNHMRQLSAKSYWSQFAVSPEFVVLFLPGEMFFSAALQDDPKLIEDGATQNVILATPTTLIALLKTIAYGWKQEDITEKVQEISKCGRELCHRLFKLGEHLNGIGKSLTGSVNAYNDAIGSLERRVWVTARKFQELQSSTDGEELPDLTIIEQFPRSLSNNLYHTMEATDSTLV